MLSKCIKLLFACTLLMSALGASGVSNTVKTTTEVSSNTHEVNSHTTTWELQGVALTGYHGSSIIGLPVITIPASVTEISDNAFSGLSYLRWGIKKSYSAK